jgi:hypothetical protein
MAFAVAKGANTPIDRVFIGKWRFQTATESEIEV